MIECARRRNVERRKNGLQAQVLATVQAWLLALVVYPGLVFGVLLILLGEWLSALVRPLLLPRSRRAPSRRRSFAQPLYDFAKLAGRRPAVRWPQSGENATVVGLSVVGALEAAGALAPMLALAFLPFPGNPIATPTGQVAGLLTVLALLAVQPLTRAALRLQRPGITSLQGAQDLGRLLSGLLPTLLVVAALVEVSGNQSVDIDALAFAPETGPQLLIRVLSGIVLLAALPWWSGWRDARLDANESAGTYAGKLLQTAALAALWSLLVLPVPGNLLWAPVVSIGGWLFAYVGMRLVLELWVPARREKDAANLLWAAALPVAAMALAVALIA